MMKLYRFKSIRSRLSFWFILVTSLSMMIALSIVYFQRAQIIERENLNRLQALRNSKASQIEDWLNEMQTDLRVFSGNFALNLINHQHGPEFDLEKFFNEKLRIIAENYSSIIDAHLISSSNCNIVYSSNHLFAGKQIDNQNVCNNIINEPKLTISDIFYSNDLNEYTMIFAIPVWINKSMRNEFDLIFIVVIDLKKSLFKILGDNSGFKSTGEALIVNSEGYSLSELKYYDNAILKAKISAKPAMQAVSGKTGLILAKDYRGEEVMAAYTYIPATRWGLVCKEDVTELNKPLTGLLHTIITVLVISVFIIVIISYYLSTRFVSQIVLLDDVAKRMASGDLSIRSEIVSDDELGDLSSRFNDMANTIESRINILNGISAIYRSLVKEKTLSEFGDSLISEVNGIAPVVFGSFYSYNTSNSEFEAITTFRDSYSYNIEYDNLMPGKVVKEALEIKSIYHKQTSYLNTIFNNLDFKKEKTVFDIIIIPVINIEIIEGVFILIAKTTFDKASVNIINSAWDIINIVYSNVVKNIELVNFQKHLEHTNKELKSKTESLQDKSVLMSMQSERLEKVSNDLQLKNQLLEYQKKQLEQLTKLKSEFISTMSHELKTPLNAIISLSGVLQTTSTKKLDSEEYNYLKIIKRNGDNLLKIIENVLEVSKIEAGKAKLNITSFSINSMLNNLLENCKSLGSVKGIEIKTAVSKNLPQVKSDEMRVHQILNNILSNAVKFTSRGYVSVTAKTDGDYINIIVEDTGIGIPNDKLSYIFNEFMQVDSSYSREFEGTGLGLAIAKKNADILGIFIDVESEIKQGTKFYILIPIKNKV